MPIELAAFRQVKALWLILAAPVLLASSAVCQPHPGELERLMAGLSDRDPFVRGASADSLGAIGRPAVAALRSALGSGNDTLRWSAVVSLWKMGAQAEEAVPSLVGALHDSNATIAWGAAAALGAIGTGARQAVPALLEAVCGRDEDLRQEASRSLERISPGFFPADPPWQSVTAVLDTLMPALMDQERVPGVSVAVISGGKTVWLRSYGVADVRSARIVNDRTLFEACSMSKPVFAAIVLKLVEEGGLDLDRPLAQYFVPSALRNQPGHERITARMVLSHTSGFPNWRRGGDEIDGPLPILFSPGTRFGYSGEGFAYLQQVVERITGEPLDSYARRVLFDPLGMFHTSFAWRKDLDTLIAAGHDQKGSFHEKTAYRHPNAAYTLYTTPHDYALFIESLTNRGRGGFLTSASADSMFAHHVHVLIREPVERPGLARGKDVYWGLGWGINTTPSGDIVYHSGSNGSGFRCYTQFRHEKKTGLVIMTNGSQGNNLWERLISRIGDF